MRIPLAVGLVSPCLLLAACGHSGPTAGSLSGKSPQQILALTTIAVRADSFSYHFVDQTRVGSKETTLIGDETAAAKDQTLSGSGSALSVLQRTDGSLFVRGAAGALESALGLSQTTAAANAGKWISLGLGDAPYSAVSGALDPRKELNAFAPTAPYSLGAPRSLDGRTVVGVSGRPQGSTTGVQANVATLYVPTEPPYTPVGATLTFGTGSGQGVEAVVFSRWGTNIDPAAPSPVVSYSTLTG